MSKKLITYPAPQGLAPVTEYLLDVDGSPVFLYQGQVYYPPYLQLSKVPFGYFDFEGEVMVRIKATIPIETVDIRPKSSGIVPVYDAHTISFKLNEPIQLSVEINGSIDNAVFLFANPLEKEAPGPEDPNVIYFAPGIHDAGVIRLESDQTLYLAGGSYVFGKIKGDQLSNIKIAGRGILNAERFCKESGKMVEINHCRKVSMEGIILLDPPNWTVRMMGCDEADIQNIKIIGWRGNSDGIDICGSRDVTVKNCFIRNWDDGLAVKAFNTGNARNIHFSNCILWNDFARPMEIGYENQADFISNIVFSNIDIIHALSGYPIMGIHQGDRAVISDILFEDIRIEDAPNAQLFDFRIKPSAWNSDPKPGRIHSIHFKNIFLNGKPGIDRLPEDSRMEGYNSESTIEDITFENINLLEKKVISMKECNLGVNEFTKNIRFVNTEELSAENACVPVESKLAIAEPFSYGSDGYWHGKVKIEVKNLSKNRKAEGAISLDITPETDLCFEEENSFHFELEPGAGEEETFAVALYPGKYFFTTQSDYVGLCRSWQVVELPWEINASIETAVKREIFRFDGSKAGTVRLAANAGQLLLEADIWDEGFAGKTETSLENALFAGKTYMVENAPWTGPAVEIFAASPVAAEKGEAVFILPETAIGRTTAVIQGEHGHLLAPELRNILEITYVFKNQPKVEKISHLVLAPCTAGISTAYEILPPISRQTAPEANKERMVEKAAIPVKTIPTENGYQLYAVIPLEALSLGKDTKEFWLEIMVSTVLPCEVQRRAITAFHSLKPEESAQMFGRIHIRNG